MRLFNISSLVVVVGYLSGSGWASSRAASPTDEELELVAKQLRIDRSRTHLAKIHARMKDKEQAYADQRLLVNTIRMMRKLGISDDDITTLIKTKPEYRNDVKVKHLFSLVK